MAGYRESFLSVDVPLPQFSPKLSSNILRSDRLRDQIFADYDNYTVVTNLVRRAPVFAALNINQGTLKTTKRKGFTLDKRIGSDFQLNNDYYLKNPWDKGHMAPREGAAWGASTAAAQARSNATFFYSNAVLQSEFLNKDEWRGLEAWVLELELAKGKRVSSFSGPIYGSWNRHIEPEGRRSAAIPAAFFKVVCFVNKDTDELDVRAFMMMHDNEALADRIGRRTYNLQTYQITVADIERFTGLLFPPEVAKANPLFFRRNAATARRLNISTFPEIIEVNGSNEIIAADFERFVVKDDDVNVYLAAAMPNPVGRDRNREWVSVLNLTDDDLDLSNWLLWDPLREVGKQLSGTLDSGNARTFKELDPIRLKNSGGIIELWDGEERVDRVDYRRKDASKPGIPIVFAYRTVP